MFYLQKTSYYVIIAGHNGDLSVSEQNNLTNNCQVGGEQEYGAFDAYRKKHELVMRTLARRAIEAGVDEDPSEMRLRLQAAGTLARLSGYFEALPPEDKAALSEQLELHDAESAVVQRAEEVIEAVHDCQDCCDDGVHEAGPSVVDVFDVVRPPASTIRALEALMLQPGVWFSPGELQGYVSDEVVNVASRAQAISAMLRKVRESPLGGHLLSEHRRHMWMVAKPDTLTTPQVSTEEARSVGEVPSSRPTPADIFAAARRLEIDEHEVTSVHEVAPVVARAVSGAQELVASPSVETGDGEEQLVDPRYAEILATKERFPDIAFDIEQAPNGAMKLFIDNIEYVCESQVVELFAFIAAAPTKDGYTIPEIIMRFCAPNDGEGVLAHRSVRRERLNEKKVLFAHIHKGIPELLKQLSPELEMKQVEMKRNQRVSASDAGRSFMGEVTRQTKAVSIIRHQS